MDWPRRGLAIPASGVTCRPCQHRPWRRPLPAETVGLRYGGARGQLTCAGGQRLLRPHSAWMSASLSPSASAPACGTWEAIPEELDSHSLLDRRRRCRRDDLHPVPDQAGRPAGAAHCPAGEADTRFPLALFARYSYHAFITDRDGETRELEADHRRHAEVENAIRLAGLNHMPSGRFAGFGTGDGLARWTARIGLGERT